MEHVKPNEFNVLYYYLAQIAVEVRRSYAKHPGRVKLKDMLIKFSTESVELSQEERSARSKFAWCGVAGISSNG